MTISIIQPAGYSSSSCGYCGPAPGKRSIVRGSLSTGAFPLQISAEVYQRAIDRGWRRSGTYMYKPDMKRTCCPQYTIRLEASKFVPSAKQRKLIRKFNNRILGPNHPDVKAKKSDDFSLISALHAAEYVPSTANTTPPAHRFTVTLEESSFTDEKYRLFAAYQESTHHEDDSTEAGFTRFLVDSPLIREEIPYSENVPEYLGLPRTYGSYHQLYRVDGELIAFDVIDVLPNCVSSVYFVWKHEWAWASLGKLSGFREIALAQEMYAYGAEGMKFQYMGFYIHTNSKMRYKADFQPSYLLDPEEYTWHEYEMCSPLLDAHKYVSFAHPERYLSAKLPTIAEGDSGDQTELPPAPDSDIDQAQPPHANDQARSPPDDADNARTSKGEGEPDAPDTSKDDPDTDTPDNASEGDIDETYPEAGNMPMGLWMNVMLVDSLDGGRVTCVPAPMHERWEEPAFRNLVVSCVEGFGEELSREIIFYA